MAGPSHMHFFGVTTGQSAMQQIFPVWMAELGYPGAKLIGVDLPLEAPAEQYRRAVMEMRDNPESAGGLVTSHKIGILEAARDLMAGFDRYAQLCGELNGISKTPMGLVAHACDPIAARAALQSFLGSGYFARTGGHVLSFGAGGAATAIAVQFAEAAKEDRPTRMVLVDRVPSKVERLRDVLARVPLTIQFEFVCQDSPQANDEVLARMPPGSLVLNGTGMGKDLPGSPITDVAVFPERAAAWELNYRGALGFLHQAHAQRQRRDLQVEDGWIYFLHGWTQVIAPVFGINLTGEIFGRLADLASPWRPSKVHLSAN